MLNVITVAAIKGGTGKTATAGALAQAAKSEGKRVLSVDLDPQANLSMWYDADLSHSGSYDLLTGSPTGDCTQEVNGNKIICAGSSLTSLTTTKGSGRRLTRALNAVSGEYDLVMVDTAPATNEALYNALRAATGLLIPLEAEPNSLQAFYQLLDLLEQIAATQGGVKILGVVITKFDARPNINRFYRDTIRDAALDAGVPFLGTIRQGVAIREAMALKQDLFEYAPRSNPATDYLELYRTITEEKRNASEED